MHEITKNQFVSTLIRVAWLFSYINTVCFYLISQKILVCIGTGLGYDLILNEVKIDIIKEHFCLIFN